MTPTEIETTWPQEVVEAWHWLDIHCRHYATMDADQQTTGNLSAEDKVTAERHLAVLAKYGLLEDRKGYKGNFIKKRLMPAPWPIRLKAMLTLALVVVGLSACSTLPDTMIPCLDIKVQVCPVKTDPAGR